MKIMLVFKLAEIFFVSGIALVIAENVCAAMSGRVKISHIGVLGFGTVGISLGLMWLAIV